MDKQKQIEEMAKDYYGYSIDLEEDCKFVAAEMYDKGHRKIHENAVLLTDKKDIQQYEWSKLVDKMGVIEFGEKVHKGTAEKFAERLKEKLNEWLEDNEDLNGKIDFGIAEIELIGVKSLKGEVIAESLIDEICKEITEGKV